MNLTVDLASATPPFSQLIAQIEGAIARRELAPGDRLPTVRQLARDMGLAANTVARAFRELEAGGLVETRGRHGTFVAAAARAEDMSADRLARAAATFVAEIADLGLDDRAVMGAVLQALAARPA